VSEKVGQKNVLYTSRKSADRRRLPNYLFLCMLESRDPFLNFIHTGASKLLDTTTEKVSNTTKALVCCKYTEHGSHVGWPFNGKLYNNRALAETYYLSLSAVIQTAVDPQHIQGLKKTRKNFTSAGRSHTNHIHKSIARHEQKASGPSTEHYSKLLPWTEIG
jgi:hypothetical protein